LSGILRRLEYLYHELRGHVQYRGEYASWNDALASSEGYDDPRILERVAKASRTVINGDAAFERDGVVFKEHLKTNKLLDALKTITPTTTGKLEVLDFGGSLGSSYFQCKPFLQSQFDLQWNIIEQSAFVKLGKAEFANQQLRFFDTVETCLAQREVDVFVLSGVLSYLPTPHKMIKDLLRHRPKIFIIDRTPVQHNGSQDRLTVQHVPANIYGKSVRYPAWVFSKTGLLKHFDNYELRSEFDALSGRILLTADEAKDTGFVFVQRSH